MNINKLKGLMALSISLTVLGLFLLFNSVNLGTFFADSWLSKQGGTADTPTLQMIAKGNMNNFLAAGSIFLGVGLATTIFAYYKILNFKE